MLDKFRLTNSFTDTFFFFNKKERFADSTAKSPWLGKVPPQRAFS